MRAKSLKPVSTIAKRPAPKRLCMALLLALAAGPILADAGPDQPGADSLLSWRDAHSADLIIFDRADLEASGDFSVGEFLRDLPQAAAGNLRPRSGSSAQSLSDLDLYGAGSSRTLVLLDGRPLTKSPVSPGVVNLNLVPLGMIESIEVVGMGGSSRYGADAAAGVINLRTRKLSAGVQFEYARGNPDVRGGDAESGTVLFGTEGDRGFVTAGVSFNRRDIVFTRDDLGGDALGSTTFGNNYQVANAAGTAPQGPIRAVPGFACNGSGLGLTGPQDLFYQTPGSTICQYNFNAVAARDASSDSASLFARAEYTINDDWHAYLNTSVRRQESFGRYAPTPAQLFVPEGSPNDPVPGDNRGAYLLHRFAAVGPRDTSVDETDRDIDLGVRGQLNERVRVQVGVRDHNSQGYELGRNYIVTRLAEAAIRDGRYDVRDPFGASADVLQSISATINRDLYWDRQEAYAGVVADVFEAGGGMSTLDVRAEWRRDDFADRYDTLQGAGEIQGSAGNSAAGSRITRSVATQFDLPFHADWNLALNARLDQFSDLNSAFSPGLELSWQPVSVLDVALGYEEGVVIPTFDQRFGDTSLSARSVVDFQTCAAQGGVNCSTTPVQVPTRIISNPDLDNEATRHAYLGVTYRPWTWLDLRLAYRDIRIDDRIVQTGFQDLVNRDLLGLPLPPGVTVGRDPVTGALQLLESRYLNQGSSHHRHVDLQANGAFDWGRFGAFESRLLVSKWQTFDLESVFSNGQSLVSSVVGDFPGWRGQWQQDWQLGDYRVTATSHWIDGYMNPTSALRVGDFVTHDVQFSWQAPWQARISVGASNVGDRKPSLDSALSDYPYNSYLYDSYGRTFVVSYQQRF